MKHLRKLIIMLLTITALSNHAQCTLENTAFKSGEVLTYNLYYNWKFVWVKVGTASLSTVQTYWNGKNVFKSSLITRGNGKLDGFFVMRDTLLSYTTTQLAPLYFRKGAREGKGYRVDEVLYDYSGGKCNLRMFRKKDDKPGVWKTESSALCVLDMLNLFVRARSFDNSNWKPGWTLKLPIADGDGLADAHLKYEGKENIKGDNGVTYRCLALTYSEYFKRKKKWKEIATFYVTDDANHVPIRIVLNLNFGSAKAYVVGMAGVRSPITAKVK